MNNGSSKSNATLNSWKEIATFLGRGVRTVQRWERELGLPVYRVRKTEHSPVFAYARELEVWLSSRSVLAPQGRGSEAGQDRLDGAEIHDFAEQPLGRSRRLVKELAALVIDQRSKAKTLAQNITTTMDGIRDRRKRQTVYDAEHKRNNLRFIALRHDRIAEVSSIIREVDNFS